MRYMSIILLAAVCTGCLPPDREAALLDNSDYLRAERLFLEERYPEVASVLRGAADRMRNPRIYILRGKALLQTGEYASAEENFRRGIASAEVLDQYVEGYLGLGDTLYSSDRYDEAAEIYSMLLDEFPGRIPEDIVMTRYSHCLIRMGRKEKGKQAAREVQQLFPDSPAAQAASELEFDADGEFYIQTGIFSRYSNAVSLRDKVSERGFKPEIIEKRGRYAVVIGYFQSVVQAQAELRRIKNAGFTKSFIKP